MDGRKGRVGGEGGEGKGKRVEDKLSPLAITDVRGGRGVEETNSVLVSGYHKQLLGLPNFQNNYGGISPPWILWQTTTLLL